MSCRWLFFLLLLCSLYSVAAEESKKILYISAANSWNNWTAVESFSDGGWSIIPVDLEGFGETMQKGNFQAALDKYEDKLRMLISLMNPIIIIVASKGLNILTHLANINVYNGPTILLSPIPNKCNHIHGETWKEEWTSSMKVLKDKIIGPVGIGIGRSMDEQDLIMTQMNETLVCGDLSLMKTKKRVVFEHCPNWFLRSFPGDHYWKNQDSNAGNIASLIIDVLESRNEFLTQSCEDVSA